MKKIEIASLNNYGARVVNSACMDSIETAMRVMGYEVTYYRVRDELGKAWVDFYRSGVEIHTDYRMIGDRWVLKSFEAIPGENYDYWEVKCNEA